jgi:DNA-binding NarL/FixJ family response regulator
VNNRVPTLALSTDLLFASRIGAEARALAAPIRFARTPEKLEEILAETDHTIPLALIDMAIESLDPASAIAQIKQAHPSARIIAFFSHIDTDAKQRAQDAGAETMPRSQFVQQLPRLLRDAATNSR